MPVACLAASLAMDAMAGVDNYFILRPVFDSSMSFNELIAFFG